MKKECPNCGKVKQFKLDKGKKLPGHFPFCSEKCKLIDLGAWFDSEYKITDKNQTEDTG